MNFRRTTTTAPDRPDLMVLPVSPVGAPASGPPGPAAGFPLLHADTGIHLGSDRAGSPVTLAVLGPRAIRIGVLGESLFGRLLACRLVAVGAAVTAVTRGPSLWTPLRAACGARLTVAEDPGSWPSCPGAAPGSGPGPQALVTDLRRPPGRAVGEEPWTTVVHVVRRAPARSVHWQRPDAVLVLGAPYADAVTPVLGSDAGRLTASLEQGEIALFRPGGVAALRPDIAPAETALLRPG
ncbi:hypothetical protein R1Y80_04670 [Streptomyces sp. JL1001]|uniref:Uncharacterized protein n=1 Tax=Streptomyces sp. JL1001 TaxID=3078227 RepID=A0AAU8K9D3_9ACTN